MTDPRDALARELGRALTPAVAALGDDDLAALTRTIADAKTRQVQALEAAAEQGLQIVPRVLRGTVRKVLFG